MPLGPEEDDGCGLFETRMEGILRHAPSFLDSGDVYAGSSPEEHAAHLSAADETGGGILDSTFLDQLMPPSTATPENVSRVTEDLASVSPRPARKRRRTAGDNDDVSNESSSDDTEDYFDIPLRDEVGILVGRLGPDEAWPPAKTSSLSVVVPQSSLVDPPSGYEGYEPPLPKQPETKALEALLKHGSADEDGEDGDFKEIELDDFCIYQDRMIGTRRTSVMRPLQHLRTNKSGSTLYYFDGILRSGPVECYVEKVPFGELSIGNYGVENHAVGGNLWIRSQLNEWRKSEVYYRLGRPMMPYSHFQAGFVWVADLAKHFVDFLEYYGIHKRKVSITDFRSNFITWAHKRHGRNRQFSAWYAAYGKADFGVAVSANIEFLYKETFSLLGSKRTWWHDIFREMIKHSKYPRQPSEAPAFVTEDDEKIPKTTVSRYIYSLFGHLPCRYMFDVVDMAPHAETRRRSIFDAAHMDLYRRCQSDGDPVTRTRGHTKQISDIRPGDTISTIPDEATVSKWDRATAAPDCEDDDVWFGLVLEVHVEGVGVGVRKRRSFDIIWYYRPSDTICGQMKYPVTNELFLSDNCTCGDARITEDQILGVHDVAFYPDLRETAEFVCRQTYYSNDGMWVSYEPSHRICPCRSGQGGKNVWPDFLRDYKPGDTVLARVKSQDEQLQVFEVDGIDHDSKYVRLRRLHRRADLAPQGAAKIAPNEVVYSHEFINRPFSMVASKCLVRFFGTGEDIPAPYNRNGVGNAWFMTHQTLDGRTCQPLDSAPASMMQGSIPPKDPAGKLRGMDLFCGGGNFGRGLEEGGAVEMRWANDLLERAIHTYMANAPDPSRVSPFVGSIDDLQRRAIEGRFCDVVPEIGQVDFISGGSPCPGFSRLTNNKSTPKQRKNQSLVAAFASMVDVYRPRFGILENVVGIVQAKDSNKEDHFCQLICAIVGMGYQARMFLGDAWSLGSCQGRSRVFLIFAAPGEKLPRLPHPTHSHPAKKMTQRGVGRLPNNARMAKRELDEAYAFPYRTARQAMADLPQVWDTKANSCIRFPDHVEAAGVTPTLRAQVKCIPHFPPGMGFCRAWNEGNGVMSRGERQLFPEGSARVQKGSHAWTRAVGDGLMDTITTSQGPGDRKNGHHLHWDCDRLLTLEESRRAQGFLDHEVLLGSTREKWHTVGNSVAREVALSLGLMFRDAVSGLWEDGGGNGRPAMNESAAREREGLSAEQPMMVDEDAVQEEEESEVSTPQANIEQVSTSLSLRTNDYEIQFQQVQRTTTTVLRHGCDKSKKRGGGHEGGSLNGKRRKK